MSSPTQPVTRIALPHSIRELFRQVRFRLRRDAVLIGLLLSVCFAALVFWTTTGLDLAWFLLQCLELPVGLRAILLALLLPAALWLIGTRVIFPLVRRIREIDVALLLERKFPQFQDRLITSVETAQGLPDEGPLGRPMLERSVSEAGSLAGTIEADDLFDATALKQLSLFAAVLFCSVAIPGIAEPQLLTRWWSAFIRCDETYHQRTTDLTLVAVAQPGDRRIPFQTDGSHQTYRHPRGADLELEMVVPDGGPAEGKSWVVPDRVRVDVIRADGSRSRTYVSPAAASDRTFRFVVTRLQEPVQIELLAGDYRTRTPYQIDVVNPPGIDAIQLRCVYPDYTGWNQQRETTLTVTGSEIQLPVGTAFELNATTSKSLRAVRIVSDQFELTSDRDGSTRRLQNKPSQQILGQPLIAEDGRTISARFEIVSAAKDSLEASVPEANTGDHDSIAADQTADSGTSIDVQHIPVSTNLRFFLHDDDDVMSVSPETLHVHGIEDKPPVVTAQMTGIDNAVTRFAKIPIAGRIRDDYGLKSAGFEFLVDDESVWRPRPFRSALIPGMTDYEMRRSEDEPFEIFDVQVLELSEGQTLTLTITAADSNLYPGPGVTRGEPMLFRIVSIEELLSLLYTREIALRGRFEEVISQLEQLHSDLQFHQDVATRLDAAGSAALQEDVISLNTSAVRSGNNLRRQANELIVITEGFEEVVRQLVNNAVPPQQLADNMRSSIVDPLSAVSDNLIPSADRAVGLLRVAAQDGQTVGPLVTAARAEVEQVVTALKLILENVRDMAEFHEALRDLKAILDELQENLEDTKRLQKNQLIDDILK